MNRMLVACFGSIALQVLACNDSKKTEESSMSASSSSATTASSAAASSSAASMDLAVPAGDERFEIETGKGSFLIDAPLEKIKGMSDESVGHLDVNPKDLTKSSGVIKVRLSTLKTSTFGDMDKDVSQTEHARNWMEVGNDSSADTRMKYEWAILTVNGLEATPASLDAAPDASGSKTVSAKVSGDLAIHGVTSKVVVPVTLTFKGPADAPTEVDVKTDQAMPVSMKEHMIMPRDKVGGLLNGALERIGKKIDDNVQVSFEGIAKASMPKQP